MQPKRVKMDSGHSRISVALYTRVCYFSKATHRINKESGAFYLGRKAYQSVESVDPKGHYGTSVGLPQSRTTVFLRGRCLFLHPRSCAVPEGGVRQMTRHGLLLQGVNGHREKLQYLGS